jgi:TonB family protein
VKRLLLSIILALGFHAIILSADFRWLKLAPQPTSQPRSIAIVLSTFKRQMPESPADLLGMKQFAPKKSTSSDKMAEKQPKPNLSNKADKSSDSVQNPTPIRLKKNLKALTLKKQTINTIEKVHTASFDKRPSPLAAEAKTGIPSNSSSQAPGLLTSPDSASIKNTNRAPSGPSEPLTTAAAVPAKKAKGILSESVSVHIAWPLYKQNASPDYPLRARRMGYEGLVMLKVLVDVSGQVEDLEVVRSSGYSILDNAAISTVKKWVFEPGTEGGKKKKMWVKIPIRFELE